MLLISSDITKILVVILEISSDSAEISSDITKILVVILEISSDNAEISELTLLLIITETVELIFELILLISFDIVKILSRIQDISYLG